VIASHAPGDWRDLQDGVARILRECGFDAEVEKPIQTERGPVNVDIAAEEIIRGRRNASSASASTCVARVPQAVIHGFRTVVSDSGANVGYIVSSAAFRRARSAAADLSNVRLVTWEGFQAEFEQSWIDHWLLPTITERLDPLFSHTEPLLPRLFSDLSDDDCAAYMRLRDEHESFGWLMTLFTTRAVEWMNGPVMQLPVRVHATERMQQHLDGVPVEVVDAVGYRDSWTLRCVIGEAAIAAFRAMLARAIGDVRRPTRHARIDASPDSPRHARAATGVCYSAGMARW
jgi:restriction system protein